MKSCETLTKPLVSVVIPCRNAEGYVGEAVESALSQTYRDVEVIVVDDGSEDRSQRVIRAFGNRVRLVINTYRGASAARNAGIKVAQGELVQFLDADDLLFPGKLEQQVPVVSKSPHATVYCDFVRTDMETGKASVVPRNSYNGEDIVVFPLMHQRLGTSAPIHWKTNLIAVGGFDERLDCCQEYDLHCRLGIHGIGWLHFPEVLYTWRNRSGSVSSDLLRVMNKHAEVLSRLKEYMAERDELNHERRAALATVLVSDARNYLRHGKRKAARRYFRMARELSGNAGLEGAYSPAARAVRRVFGAYWTEKLVTCKRNYG